MKLNPNVYLKASERIVRVFSRLSCFAIVETNNMPFHSCTDDEYVKEYASLLGPKNPRHHCYYIDGWFGSYYIDENQLARSLALLFMYEVTKDEQKRLKRKQRLKVKHKR